ncbi:MAG: hypothetical protein JXP34_05115 [Planctomycetes bacterium]|nr:hypothetical protein [Planctomycetota bacterium]
MDMDADLERLLEHLERTIDPARVREIDDLHRRALSWEPVARLPLTLAFPIPDDAPFRPFAHHRALDDPAAMLANELTCAFGTSIALRDRIDDDLPPSVRANLGTGIIASLFGARIERTGDNPPWVRPFDTRRAFEAAIDRDPLEGGRGLGPAVLEHYAFFREALAPYPTLRESVRIVLPDLQGPFDTVGMLRGGEIFTDLADDPALVERALSAAARAQVGFARRLAPHLSDGPDGFAHQHAVMIAGRILIRDDAAILIPPAMYRDIVAPHDEEVFRASDGGGIHACERIDRHAEAFLALPSIRCIDLGEPHRNDLDALYARARERRVAIVRARVPEEDIVTGRVCDRFPTGVTLVHEAASLAGAARILAAYRAATAPRGQRDP